jgi:hypothetical protein
MWQQMSRRSALKVASGLGCLSAWSIAGCSGESEVNPDLKTDAAKSADESIVGRARKGKKAEPATTQRIKGGPG